MHNKIRQDILFVSLIIEWIVEMKQSKMQSFDKKPIIMV